MFSIVTAILFLLFTLLFYKYSTVPRDFPPGPGRLPIVGSYLKLPLKSGVLVAASDWFVKHYGKLVGVYLGNWPAVVVYDYEMCKEIFNQDHSVGRPENFVYKFRMLGQKLGYRYSINH